jgi:hypothetical protein
MTERDTLALVQSRALARGLASSDDTTGTVAAAVAELRHRFAGLGLRLDDPDVRNLLDIELNRAIRQATGRIAALREKGIQE